MGRGVEGPGAPSGSIELYQLELAQQNEELRASREELARSVRRYVDLYELAPVGLLTLDDRGTIAQLNGRAKATLGPAGAVGRPFLAAIAPAGQARLRDVLADPGPSMPVVVELAGASGDGADRWVEISVAAGQYSDHDLVIAIVDMTAQRRAETDLRRTQQILALSNRIARIGQWEIDLGTKRVHWSDVTCEIHGVGAGFEPDTAAALDFYPEGPHRDRIRAAIKAAIQRGTPFDLELQIRNADGKLVWVRAIGMAEHADGCCRRLYGTFQDIDTRLKLEQARLAQARAEAASRAKSEFLARMSHELRTPLNAVLGFSELLAQEPAIAASTSGRTAVGHIHDAGRHLLALVDDVLDLARIEAGMLDAARQSIDLHELAVECRRLVAPLAERHGVAVHVKPPETTLHVLADRRRALQVIANLLSNAIKYNRPGGSADVSLRADGTSVVMAVRDTGLGMSQVQLAGLYQPFNRLGAEHSDIEGTGLGLAITRQLLEAMGGALDVTSVVGQGSTFEVRWPRDSGDLPGESGATDEGLPPSEPPSGELMVVCVEDNRANAELVRLAMAKRPRVRLEVAGDGVAGLEAIRRLRPRLALIDINLPKLDGVSVVRAIRADPALAGVTCVAVSARALQQDIDDARAQGFDEYLVKPVSIARLHALVDRLSG
jgi:PAS domain S-box-containing protein